MDFIKGKKEVMITSQYAIVEGEMQLPLHDLCDERDSKNMYEVAGVSQYPSACANTLGLNNVNRNAYNKFAHKLAIANDRGCRKHKEKCQHKTYKQS